MSQTHTPRGVATSVRSEDGWTHVRYHLTDVVSFKRDFVILRTGGWFTATTKLRMNQAANQFGLGYHVYQKQFAWFVRFRGHVFTYNTPETTLHRREPINPPPPVEEPEDEPDEEEPEYEDEVDKDAPLLSPWERVIKALSRVKSLSPEQAQKLRRNQE